MRKIIYIFLVTSIGCADTTNKDKIKEVQLKTEKKSATTTSDPLPNNCSAIDIFKLRDKRLHDDFFKQLDSIRKAQYPNNDQDTNNSVDISPDMLKQFLKDIDPDTLQKNGIYESHYFFGISPPQFIDSKKCKDKIEIQYFSKDCEFRMAIDNVYLVEKRDCIGGSQVLYIFKIVDGKVVDFGRNEAG